MILLFNSPIHLTVATLWIGGMLFLFLVAVPLLKKALDPAFARREFVSQARRFRMLVWGAPSLLLVNSGESASLSPTFLCTTWRMVPGTAGNARTRLDDCATSLGGSGNSVAHGNGDILVTMVAYREEHKEAMDWEFHFGIPVIYAPAPSRTLKRRHCCILVLRH